MLDQLVIPVVEVVKSLLHAPAVQGMVVAAVTQAVKTSPVGPTQGVGVRILAATLAVAAQVAGAAAKGDITQIDAEQVAQHMVEALSAFLAAVGAWQLARKK
jgi:mannose/fructose/N-acetylgalactosamine-specific phosphotransferase system component IID